MEQDLTFSSIIGLWPSVSVFASEVGAEYPTAAAWKHRDSIPPAKWRVVIEAAEKRGHALSMEQLASLAEQKRSPTPDTRGAV